MGDTRNQPRERSDHLENLSVWIWIILEQEHIRTASLSKSM